MHADFMDMNMIGQNAQHKEERTLRIKPNLILVDLNGDLTFTLVSGPSP